jgi:hypothetical protein
MNQGVQDIFMGVSVVCPYIRSGTAWSTINKFCASLKLRVCEDKNGTPTFYDSKSNVAKKPIIIRPRNVFDIPSKEKVKIPNVSVSVKNIVKHENEIIDREFAFNLYQFYQTNIPTGAGPSLIDLRWVGDNNANVGVLRLLVGSKYSGISISTASINIPTNLFKFDAKPTIKIIKNVAVTGSNNITEEIIKTPTYVPESSETSLLDGGKIYAQFEDLKAISVDKRTAIVGGTIAVKGDYFEENEDLSVEYVTDSNLETVQLSSNELMQSVSMYENFARETVEAFNGIDCYEIECSFGDYYYENGGIALDFSKGQIFQRYDTVIPYVFIDGVEQPLESYEDEFGNIKAKSFNIVGIQYNYDGHLTQKLMLQETRKI